MKKFIKKRSNDKYYPLAKTLIFEISFAYFSISLIYIFLKFLYNFLKAEVKDKAFVIDFLRGEAFAIFYSFSIFAFILVLTYSFSKKHLINPLKELTKELRDLTSEDNIPMVSLTDEIVEEVHVLKDTTNLFIQEIFALKESYKIIIDERMEKYDVVKKENSVLEEEVKEKTKEAIEKEYKFESIFKDSNAAIAIGDKDGNIVEYNKSYSKLLEYDSNELIGTNFSDLTHPEDFNIQKQILIDLFSKKINTKRLEKRYVTKNSNIVWADLSFTEIHNESNEVVNFAVIAIDITKRKKYEEELQKLYSLALDANALTGLPGNNTIRKYIEEILENKSKSCIIYADLDYFKAYNDNYGFAMGDKIIKYVAELFQILAEKLNLQEFFIGHIGGDDFVIIIPMENTKEYITELLKEFDKEISSFYREEDVSKGYIVAANREGVLQDFSMMSLSLAGLDLSDSIASSYLEINDALLIAKKEVKRIAGSSFYLLDL